VQDKSVAEFLDIARMHVAALNEAIAGIAKGAGAAALLLGQLGRPARARRATERDPTGAVWREPPVR